MKKRRKKTRIKMCVLLSAAALLLLLGLFASGLVPNDPYATNAAAKNMAPCGQFLFGTDRYGRCIFSRVLMGARTSIFSAVFLVCLTCAAGTLLGMVAGYYGGLADTIVMRLVDILLAFPQMVLAIAVAGILGGGLANAMIAIGASGWTLYARLARSQVMSMKKEPYIYAARLSGCGDLVILFRYMLPNLTGIMTVSAATSLGSTMMGIAGLSFLGIGVMPPQAEWGSMINEARAYMQITPWAVLAPAAAMVITVMVFNYLGDVFQDWMEVKTR